MDNLIAAAGRALSAGDTLAALRIVALRNDAAALALRGIAMAQLGDLPRARKLLREAARKFEHSNPVAHARCIVAQAEIALASRELAWPATKLVQARRILRTHGDLVNAAQALCLQARRLVLLGQSTQALDLAQEIDASILPAALRTFHELTLAGIAVRRREAGTAERAVARARSAALAAHIPSLLVEVDAARNMLRRPAALMMGSNMPLDLAAVEAMICSGDIVVDACRHAVHQQDITIDLARRPILFRLLRILAEAWPQDAARNILIGEVFRTRYVDDTLRVRLRVELARLRMAIAPIGTISATERGFRLDPRSSANVAVLSHPVETRHAPVLALLSDGRPWSSSALAAALNVSQRTVQRSLEALAERSQVQCYGRGRARRWIAGYLPGFTTTLLLPSPLSDA